MLTLRSSLFAAVGSVVAFSLLFVGCALVPIALLAFLSVRHMSRQLDADPNRLHQANRALGLAVFERLLLLDATLKSIPPRAMAELAAGAKPAPASPARGAPKERPYRPGNGIQGARTDGRIAIGGVVLDRARRRSAGRPAPPPRGSRGEPHDHRRARPAGPQPLHRGGVLRRRWQAHGGVRAPGADPAAHWGRQRRRGCRSHPPPGRPQPPARRGSTWSGAWRSEPVPKAC